MCTGCSFPGHGKEEDEEDEEDEGGDFTSSSAAPSAAATAALAAALAAAAARAAARFRTSAEAAALNWSIPLTASAICRASCASMASRSASLMGGGCENCTGCTQR